MAKAQTMTNAERSRRVKRVLNALGHEARRLRAESKPSQSPCEARALIRKADELDKDFTATRTMLTLAEAMLARSERLGRQQGEPCA
jgi:hypothetical protein